MVLPADTLHCHSIDLPEPELINIYTGLGQTYSELRDFDLSHYYFNLAYKLFDQMDINRKFVYCTNHGNVYFFEKKYPKRSTYSKKDTNWSSLHPNMFTPKMSAC